MPTRQTTHHADRAAAERAAEDQRLDAAYPDGAVFAVVQTSHADPDTGLVDRFAVEMTTPDVIAVTTVQVEPEDLAVTLHVSRHPDGSIVATLGAPAHVMLTGFAPGEYELVRASDRCSTPGHGDREVFTYYGPAGLCEPCYEGVMDAARS